jgi:hypothetical protein
MTKEEQFNELQESINKKKEEVARGELTVDMYYAYICGMLSAALFRYYQKIPNIDIK